MSRLTYKSQMGDYGSMCDYESNITVMDLRNKLGRYEDLEEQREKGCEFCNTFDFASATYSIGKFGTHIELALCNTKFEIENQFKFCPVCGKELVK